jgi:hypothetical protein
MNESEFEKQLRTLSPAAPSAELSRAIARDLHGASTALSQREIVRRHEQESMLTRVLGGLPWAVGGAAAAAIAILAMTPPRDQTVLRERVNHSRTPAVTVASAGVFEPGESSREVIDTEESPLIFHEQREPARLVRVNSLERRTWSNAATGARVAVEVPREDLMLVPVSYQ